jgi:hypothetical protein
MTMPEAAMHQDNGRVAPEHDVWLTWEVRLVNSKPKAERVKDSTNDKLGIRIPTSNSRHVATSLLCRQLVHRCDLWALENANQRDPTVLAVLVAALGFLRAVSSPFFSAPA